MPVGSRSEQCVREFFASNQLITVGEMCECLQNNMHVDHNAIDYRTPTHQWRVFVKTTQFDGTHDYDEFKVVNKASLLLEIHPYILNNFKLVVSMTPQFEIDRERFVTGDATPGYLLQSAKISSDCEMQHLYRDTLKELKHQNEYYAKVKAGTEQQDDSIDRLNAGILKQNIVRFDRAKLMAIRVCNDIDYTTSHRSFHPLEL